jgi:predicted kinase
MNDKVLIIMRGIPGSGKSHRAKILGEGGAVFSTDEFFTQGGKYSFDPAKIAVAHEWNQNRVRDALAKGVTPVVVDNTNIMLAHVKPYLEMARSYGYKIEYAEPDSPWWKSFGPNMSKQDEDKLIKALMQKGTHEVPEAAVRKMLSQWEHDLPDKAKAEGF